LIYLQRQRIPRCLFHQELPWSSEWDEFAKERARP